MLLLHILQTLDVVELPQVLLEATESVVDIVEWVDVLRGLDELSSLNRCQPFDLIILDSLIISLTCCGCLRTQLCFSWHRISLLDSSGRLLVLIFTCGFCLVLALSRCRGWVFLLLVSGTLG